MKHPFLPAQEAHNAHKSEGIEMRTGLLFARPEMQPIPPFKSCNWRFQTPFSPWILVKPSSSTSSSNDHYEKEITARNVQEIFLVCDLVPMFPICNRCERNATIQQYSGRLRFGATESISFHQTLATVERGNEGWTCDGWNYLMMDDFWSGGKRRFSWVLCAADWEWGLHWGPRPKKL